MSLVKADVVLSTCGDERYPPSSMLDGKPNTYFMTTGLYPQEIILGMKAGPVNLSRIHLSSSGIKKLRLDKCTDTTATRFETIVECEVANREAQGRQVEQFQLNKATAGANINFVKIAILSGYEDFSAIYDFAMEGEAVGSASSSS